MELIVKKKIIRFWYNYIKVKILYVLCYIKYDKIWYRGVFFKLVMWDKYFVEKDWYLFVWYSLKNRFGVNYFEF